MLQSMDFVHYVEYFDDRMSIYREIQNSKSTLESTMHAKG